MGSSLPLVLACFLAWRKGAKPQLVERLNSCAGELGASRRWRVLMRPLVG